MPRNRGLSINCSDTNIKGIFTDIITPSDITPEKTIATQTTRNGKISITAPGAKLSKKIVGKQFFIKELTGSFSLKSLELTLNPKSGKPLSTATAQNNLSCYLAFQRYVLATDTYETAYTTISNTTTTISAGSNSASTEFSPLISYQPDETYSRYKIYVVVCSTNAIGRVAGTGLQAAIQYYGY